jgi:hypothetical protein
MYDENSWEADEFESSVCSAFNRSARNFAIIRSCLLTTQEGHVSFKQMKLEQDLKGLNAFKSPRTNKNACRIYTEDR